MEDLNAVDLNKNIKITLYYTTVTSKAIRFTHYGLLDKLTAIQVTDTFLAFYGTQQFITMFTRANTGPQYEQDDSSVPLTFKFISILSYHLH